MPTSNPKTSVTLLADKPTTLTFQQLHDWVIWQIPRVVEDGLCGAVKTAVPDTHWYPAIIHVNKKKVQVYAHIDKQFATPEAASSYFT